MILGINSLVRVDKHMIWWIWSLPGNPTTTKPLIKWYGIFQYETPLFGRLDPPIIAKTCHNHCVYMISHDTFQSLFAKLMHTVILCTSASWSSPKWLASRLGPSNFRCPGDTPGKGIDLKFVENVSSLVLGKFRKFQHRSSSRFRDILERPEGWMTPPDTNRVKF